MKIGILGAINEEIILLKNAMNIAKEVSMAGRTFYIGTINGIETVLVLAKIGKVAAAITTSVLINNFNVDAVVFTGVAGAVDEELNIGDIVVSDNLVQHDMDASPIFPKYEIPLLGINSIEASHTLNQALKRAITNFVAYSFAKEVSHELKNSFGIKTPQVHFGTIVSGDQFVKSTETTNRIRNEIKNAKCVEMEGAAVAQVCHEFKVPFSVIRVISDKADHSAPVDFNKFLELASVYSKGIIHHLLNENTKIF